MRLIITRHGKTIQNESGVIMGRTPGELSELGHKQAEQIGSRLSGENIDVIYSSPSSRCKDTLIDILKQFETKPPVEFVEDLQERDFGQLTGRAMNPSLYSLLEDDTEESRELGIESIGQLFLRTKSFIDFIKEKNIGKTVLVLTHSNNIRAMLMYFMNKTFVEILDVAKVRNCSYTEFQIDEKEGSIQVFLDDSSHLVE